MRIGILNFLFVHFADNADQAFDDYQIFSCFFVLFSFSFIGTYVSRNNDLHKAPDTVGNVFANEEEKNAGLPKIKRFLSFGFSNVIILR